MSDIFRSRETTLMHSNVLKFRPEITTSKDTKEWR